MLVLHGSVGRKNQLAESQMTNTTRRKFVKRGAALAGTGLVQSVLPRVVLAQDGDQAAIDRLAADMQTHAGFGMKFSGGPGDNATADWTADRLRRLGYRVEVSEFEAPYFVNRKSELKIGGRALQVLPQAPVVVTGASGIGKPMALVEDDGLVGDVADRIVVIRAPFERHAALFPTRGIGMTVKAVADAGAAAIVIVTTGPSKEAVALNCPADGPFVPVPVAILAPRVAGPVIAAARVGANATFTIDGDATTKPCKNVVARIQRGPQWIAMSTPRSGWFQCVAERGTGQAAFLEIAAWLADRYPQHSVFLMNTGGHEYFFAGSHRVIDQAPPPENTLVWAHIGATLAARDATEVNGEWVMNGEVDPFRRTMASEKALVTVADSFAGLVGLDNPGLVQPQAGELSTFTDMGYEKAFACIGQHRWFHTQKDTIDCVDARLLLPVLRAHQLAIERLVDL